MKIIFSSKQISDLNGESILKDKTLSQLKRVTDILVIDDDVFTFLDVLKKHEFNIDHKPDIQSLKDVEAYDIILCDIRGVGKFLGSKYEGAYLIKQIKEKYPNKIVISYTANDYDPSFQEYLKYADAIMPKGSALEDWAALLERILRENADPVKQWSRTREALLNANVPTAIVAEYEVKYVKAIQSGSFESIKKTFDKPNKVGAEIMFALVNSIIDKMLKKNEG